MYKLVTRPGVEEIIKKELEITFGRSIASNRDCVALSEDIFRKTHQQLNPNTLRRIFGLVKSKHRASQSTHTILAQYCGFSSVQDLYNHKHADNEAAADDERLLKYVVGLFLEIPVKHTDDTPFLPVIKNTILLLNQHLSLGAKFLGIAAKTKNGQYFYFECFVNIDHLHSYYGNCIRYYVHEKGNDEARLFAQALTVYKDWLNADKENLLRYAKTHLSTIAMLTNVGPLVAARYFASLLLATAANQAVSQPASAVQGVARGADNIIQAIDHYHRHSTCKNDIEWIIFHYVIGQALVIAGCYAQAMYYLNECANLRTASKNDNNLLVGEENLQLLKAVAIFHLQTKEAAIAILEKINPVNYHFLDRKLMELVHFNFLQAMSGKVDGLPVGNRQGEEMRCGKCVSSGG